MSSKHSRRSGKSDLHLIRFSKSSRANITFPVSRVQRYLKSGNYAKRIGIGSAVYLASVLQYLVTEILELSIDEAKLKKRSQISPRFIMMAIRKDVEFSELLCKVTIAAAGVVPHILPVLERKQSKYTKD